jgi:hypothetical protein
MADKRGDAKKVDEELYFVIEENNQIFTDKGVDFLSGEDPDFS